MTRLTPALLLVLAACSEDSLSEVDASSNVDQASYDPQVWIHVVPADQQDALGNLRALPQDFGPFRQSELTGDATRLSLSRPIRAFGTLTGEEVTPYAALGGLPTTSGPIPGRISLRDAFGVTAYEVPTAEDGSWSISLVPGSYELLAIPDSARIAPTWSQAELLEDERRDLTLSPGQSIYGRITRGGAGFPDCAVYGIDALGHETAPTLTDVNGRYELRVPVGSWSVVTLGDPEQRDPALMAAPVEVTETLGAPVDLAYPARRTIGVSLRVEGADGEALDGVPVRLTALSLDDYDGLAPELVIESRVYEGDLDLLLPPGVWTIALLPEAGDARSAVVREAVALRDTNQTEELSVPGLRTLSGLVSDAGGAPLAESRITCEELGYSGRSWTTFTGADGAYTLDVSATAARCTAQPPGERAELVLRNDVLEAGVTEWSFLLETGSRVEGTVRLEDAPEAYAVVELRRIDGSLLGTALTDSDGRWSTTLPSLP